VVDVPDNMTIAQVKSDLWTTVTRKLPNPRAKTMVQGNTIIIVPDDKSTFEVMSRVQNVRSVEPKRPRVIVYDVDNNIPENQVINAIMEQNPELGLSQDDIDSMQVRHKLGPREGSTTHWVIETPADVLVKLENRSVFIGLTRCRIRLHRNIPQCYNCPKFGHTSAKCNQEKSTCKHCAADHDSRECVNKEATKCSNCKGKHKASSSACKARDKAIQGLLRRTDFGPK